MKMVMYKKFYRILLVFVCMCFVPIGSKAQNTSPFAVHAHVHGGGEHNQVPANLRMMKEAGIHWIRFDFTWPDVEPAQGAWSFDRLDRVVEEADKLGLNILGIFLHDRPWAKPAYEHLDAWETYVKKVVTRYKDKVRCWEVWNEPNLYPRFWDKRDEGESYALLLKTTYKIIKEIDPEITVVYAGLAGIPMSYIEKSFAAGSAAAFDKMAVHPYRSLLSTMEDTQRFIDDLERLRALMTRYNIGHKGIWFTEMGFSSMAGVVNKDKNVFHEMKAETGKDWRVAVICDDEFPIDQSFTEETLRSLFPSGFRLDTVQLLEMRRAFSQNVYDAVFFPPADNIPLHVSQTVTPYLTDYMRRGGKVFYYTREGNMYYYGDAAEKEINQAIYLTQTMWLSLRFGIERYFWYEFESPERSFFERESHFGLTRRGLSPKPAYHAYATMGKLFPEGSQIDTAVEWKQNDCCVVSWKQPDGTRVWAVWSPEGDRQAHVKIGGGLQKALNYLGDDLPAVTSSSGTLETGAGVIYLVGAETLEIKETIRQPEVTDYAAAVAGVYQGNGKLWAPGDVENVVITLEYVNKTTVKATVDAVLPKELRQLGGTKTMTGEMTVSSEYELSGKLPLYIIQFAGSGTVDPTNRTIELNIIGKPLGYHLHFILKGEKQDDVK